MRTFLKIIAGIFIIVVGLVLYIQLTWQVSFDEEYPVKEITIEADSAMLAHGEYLVYGPAHCVHCHAPISELAKVEAGEKVPLIGGFEFGLPIGNLYSPNITPDPETGIGNFTDGQLYRMLRHNITAKGLAALELMPFTTMSEYDVKAVIAYIRNQEPVRNVVPENSYNLIGKAVKKFAIKPAPLAVGIPEKIEKDSSALYGKYLSESVANCRGCHTNRDLSTGAYIGPFYAGGLVFEPAPETNYWKFVTSNLTMGSGTGVMEDWNEEAFVNRFLKVGRVHQYSPMPWGAFKFMDETDLKAIYRFLQTVEPVNNQITETAFPPAQ